MYKNIFVILSLIFISTSFTYADDDNDNDNDSQSSYNQSDNDEESGSTSIEYSSKDGIVKLYVATFDRAPDSAGLDYWASSGVSIENIARSFFDQPETKAKYPDGTTTQEFVSSVYRNLFRREADVAGADYWVNALDSGAVEKSTFILAVVNGALGDDAVIL